MDLDPGRGPSVSPVTTPTVVPGPREHLLGARYRGATTGAFTLVFLAAFEALAVATVMPEVTADLDGRQWYAVAFSATLAASVVGMVATGAWADRVGAVKPLLATVGGFGAGLLVAGLAPGIEVLVVGRFLQGLGAGGLTVALYVLVGQVFDPPDRPRVLGVFALAWVLPGLVGPLLAGVVADTVGWRWVFLGVVGLAGAALAALVPSLRRVDPPVRPDADPHDDRAATPARRAGVRRLGLAAVVAAAVVGLNLAGSLDGAARAAAGAVALAVAVVAVRPLLPPATLRLARGLPAVVGVRGLLGGAFFASEAYLPYLLQEQYAVSVAVSGLVLTAATLGWAAASQVQGRLGDRLADERALALGPVLVTSGIAAVLVATALGLHPLVIGLGWTLTASGMGLAFPRTTNAVLARTSPSERGSASSALTISDAVGAASSVAVVGLVFTAVGTAADRSAFVAVLGCTVAVGALAVFAGRRT
ncbi:MAG: MFS transporter [Nocardioides sp.]|nr:MFS transporter [Nocardioides sp.]